MRKQINIEGMSCNHCAKHVTSALEEISGVKSVDVNLQAKTAVIETDQDVIDSNIRNVIEDAGYDVVSIVELN
jgi:copper ion binding protein